MVRYISRPARLLPTAHVEDIGVRQMNFFLKTTGLDEFSAVAFSTSNNVTGVTVAGSKQETRCPSGIREGRITSHPPETTNRFSKDELAPYLLGDE